MFTRPSSRRRGFTLVELMIVISIILILISVALPLYQQSLRRAREAVLAQNLFALRNAIDQYTLDKKRAPQTLEDLVSAGYLREIPMEPIAGSRDCWEPVQEDYMLAVDQTQPGITDVHSCSDATSSDGTPYSSW